MPNFDPLDDLKDELGLKPVEKQTGHYTNDFILENQNDMLLPKVELTLNGLGLADFEISKLYQNKLYGLYLVISDSQNFLIRAYQHNRSALRKKSFMALENLAYKRGVSIIKQSGPKLIYDDKASSCDIYAIDKSLQPIKSIDQKLFQKLLELVRGLHKIKLRGFGNYSLRKREIIGNYRSQGDFFEAKNIKEHRLDIVVASVIMGQFCIEDFLVNQYGEIQFVLPANAWLGNPIIDFGFMSLWAELKSFDLQHYRDMDQSNDEGLRIAKQIISANFQL